MRHLALLLGLSLVAPLPAAPQDPPAVPRLKEIFRIGDRDVRSVSFNPRSTRLAVAGRRLLRVLDLPPGGTSKDLPTSGDLTEVAWETADRFIVTRTSSGQTNFIDWPSGVEVRFQPTAKRPDFEGQKPPGRGPATFNPSGTVVALANQVKGFRIWSMDFLDGKPLKVPERDVQTWHDGTLNHVTALRFAGHWLLVGQEDGYLCAFEHRLLDPSEPVASKEDPAHERPGHVTRRTLSSLGAFKPHSGEVTSVALTPDHSWVVTAGWEGSVKAWTVEETRLLKLPLNKNVTRPPKPAWTGKGRHVAWNAPKNALAVAERDGVRIYRFQGDPKQPLVEESFAAVDPSLGTPVRSQFNSNGSLLAVLCCPCGICRNGGGGAQDGNRRSYDHGGKLVLFDTKPGTPDKEEKR